MGFSTITTEKRLLNDLLRLIANAFNRIPDPPPKPLSRDSKTDVIIVGQSNTGDEVAVIRDFEGEVYVDIDFAFNNPDYYQYVGVLEINGEVIHFFEFK